MSEQKQTGTLLVTNAGVVLLTPGSPDRSLPFGSALAVKWGMHWLTGTVGAVTTETDCKYTLANRGDYVGLMTGMQAWVSESLQEEWVRLIEDRKESE